MFNYSKNFAGPLRVCNYFSLFFLFVLASRTNPKSECAMGVRVGIVTVKRSMPARGPEIKDGERPKGSRVAVGVGVAGLGGGWVEVPDSR